MMKIAGLALLLITGCSTTHVITSIPEKEIEKNEFRYYDTDSNVMYQVSNDEKNLHLKFKTANPSSAMKILKQGLHVYFDANGKKKRKIFLQYPIPGNERASGLSNQRPVPDQRNSTDLSQFIKNIPKEAVFSNNGEVEYIHWAIEESEIRPFISLSANREIVYDLIIPFNRIMENMADPLSNLSIGIVSGSKETSSMGSGSNGGMRSGGGGSKGSGGGMRGGGGMGGGKGGGGAKSRGMQGSQPGGNMSIPIKIWFQVDLYE